MLKSFHNTEFMQAHDVGDQTKPHGVINYPTKILFKQRNVRVNLSFQDLNQIRYNLFVLSSECEF